MKTSRMLQVMLLTILTEAAPALAAADPPARGTGCTADQATAQRALAEDVGRANQFEADGRLQVSIQNFTAAGIYYSQAVSALDEASETLRCLASRASSDSERDQTSARARATAKRADGIREILALLRVSTR